MNNSKQRKGFFAGLLGFGGRNVGRMIRETHAFDGQGKPYGPHARVYLTQMFSPKASITVRASKVGEGDLEFYSPEVQMLAQLNQKGYDFTTRLNPLDGVRAFAIRLRHMPDMRVWPVAPTLVIRESISHQLAVWVLHETIELGDENDVVATRHSDITRVMSERLQGKPVWADAWIPLAGFKTGKQNFVSWVEASGRRVSADELLRAFGVEIAVDEPSATDPRATLDEVMASVIGSGHVNTWKPDKLVYGIEFELIAEHYNLAERLAFAPAIHAYLVDDLDFEDRSAFTVDFVRELLDGKAEHVEPPVTLSKAVETASPSTSVSAPRSPRGKGARNRN